MEKALGIRVVRHITKKPAGDAVDLEKHFRSARQLPVLLPSGFCLSKVRPLWSSMAHAQQTLAERVSV